MVKRGIIFGVFLVSIILAVSVVVVAKPSFNAPNDVVPAHAVEVSKGVFSLGTATDVDGEVVEGFMFIHNDKDDKDNRKAHAKPGTECGNGLCEPGENANKCPSDCTGDGTDDNKGSSSCYSLFAKGASWKTTEDYTTGAGVDLTLTETSLDAWDSEVPFNIFGTGTSGTTDGADLIIPDGKNEVEFQDLGPTNTIAFTVVWGIFSAPPPFNELVEWDAVFNTAYTFGDADKDPSVMDYQNIATHEFGHALGLNHPEDSCTEETMYAFAEFGETKKRTLEAGDTTGLDRLY